MRNLVLTSALLLAAIIACAQTAPPAQQTPNSQFPGEPGTPTQEQRPGTPATAPRTQLPPEQPQAQKPEEPAPPSTAEQQGASANSSGPLTIEGCLNATNGKFNLTDESRGTFELTGADRKLGGEVGHTVQVTGTASNAAAPETQAPGVSANSQQEENETTQPATNPPPDGGQQLLHVSTVKVISPTCNDVPQR